MKNKRFWAALLCTAMVLTSSSFNVSAAMQDSLLATEDTVLSAEMTEEAEGIVDTEETLSVETEELANDGETLGEELIVEDGSETVTEDALTTEGGVIEDITLDAASADTEDPEGTAYDDQYFVVSQNAMGYNELRLKDPTVKLSDTGRKSFTIPASANFIPKSTYLFENNANLTSVQFEDGVVSNNLIIEEGAFANSSIESFYSPWNYNNVSANTFNGCSNLKTFDFKNISTLSENAFAGCRSLGGAGSVITWSKQITKVEKAAFKNTGFTNLLLEDLNNTGNVELGPNVFDSCSGLVSVTVPANIKVIPAYCFANCDKLSNVIVKTNDKGTIVKEYAFQNCTSLTQIGKDSFKASTISANAFDGCKNLVKVLFPETVVYVGDAAFNGCTAIKLIEFHYNKNEEASDAPIISQTAFPDPIPSMNVTMRGYDGLVKAFANNINHRFKYESLAVQRDVKANNAKDRFLTGATFTPTPSKARAGEEVTFTTSPRETGYRIRREDMYDINGGLTAKDIKFVEGDINTQKFMFYMPANEVVIDVTSFYLDKEITGGNSSYTAAITGYDGGALQFRKIEGGIWRANHPGFKGQILIDATKDGNAFKIGQWMFEYKSSNTKVASVESNGVITSEGPGDATITAKYKGSPSFEVKIPVNVGPKADLNYIEIKSADTAYTITQRNPAAFIDGKMTSVLSLAEQDLASNDIKVNLKLIVKENATSGDEYSVSANWISGDTKIATVEKASTKDNKNSITLKKGMSGDTYIKVSHNTYRKDRDGNDIVLEAYLLVKIVDNTPRVPADDIIINTNCDDASTPVCGGTPIKIQPADGLTIDMSKPFDLYHGKSVNNCSDYHGLKLIKPADTVEHDGVTFRLVYDQNGDDAGIPVNKNKTYTGNNKIFIKGKYTTGATFTIALNKVIIENKPLPLNLKMSGTINMLYNSDCYDPIGKNIAGHYDELERKVGETDQEYRDRYVAATVGKIDVANDISIDTAEVITAELWSEHRYKLWKNGYAPEAGYKDPFANNFNIRPNTDTTFGKQDFIIVRSGNPLSDGVELVNGKEVEVTKGYIAVYFKGYSKPVVQAVKLPVKTAAPSYVMSETSIMESAKNTAGIFRFRILDSTRKKVMLSNNSIAELKMDESSTGSFTPAKDGEDIKLTASGARMGGNMTAVVSIRRTNWGKPVNYKFTVKYVDKDPAAKFKSSTLKLNRWYNAIPVQTELALDQANCVLSIAGTAGSQFVYSGSDKLAADAGKINITTSAVANYSNKLTVTASFKNSGDLPVKGTYKYKFTPQYAYVLNGVTGAAVQLKPMTINVTVLNNQPKVRVNGATYTFNTDYPGYESKEVIATVANAPAGIDVDKLNIDVSNPTWTLYKSAKDASIANTVSSKITISKKYDTKKKKWILLFKLGDTGLKNRDFNITYTVSKIKVNGSEAEPIRITIKGINKMPKVGVSKSGTLNNIDYTSVVKYKTKFTNLTNPDVIGIDVVSSNGNISDYIKAERDKDDPNVVNVRIIPGAEMPNSNYEFRLKYKIIPGVPLKDVYTAKLKLKPSQKMPTIKTLIENRAKKAVFYSGVSDASRTVKVDLTKTSQIKTHICNPNLSYVGGIKIKDSNAAILKNAFVIDSYIPEGWDNKTIDQVVADYDAIPKTQKKLPSGTIVIKCVNPELLQAGKTYNLVLEAEFDGQFYKTDRNGNFVRDKNGKKIKLNGATFKVPVVVYK